MFFRREIQIFIEITFGAMNSKNIKDDCIEKLQKFRKKFTRGVCYFDFDISYYMGFKN
jgi:hypothetical protein